MYRIITSNKFVKDLKLLKKRSNSDFSTLSAFAVRLGDSGVNGVEKRHRPHKLSGKYSNCWECHVKSDLLIIWRESEEELIIELVRADTHSDLFG